MPDSTSMSTTVAAPAYRVMDIIENLEKYPQWLNEVKTIEILEPLDVRQRGRLHRVLLTVETGIFKDTYEVECRKDDDGLGLQWDLISGRVQRAQHGKCRLKPQSTGGTKVELELSIQLVIPVIGLLKRKAEEILLQLALRRLQDRMAQEEF